jgi:hypothetical protein
MWNHGLERIKPWKRDRVLHCENYGAKASGCEDVILHPAAMENTTSKTWLKALHNGLRRDNRLAIVLVNCARSVTSHWWLAEIKRKRKAKRLAIQLLEP